MTILTLPMKTDAKSHLIDLTLTKTKTLSQGLLQAAHSHFRTYHLVPKPLEATFEADIASLRRTKGGHRMRAHAALSETAFIDERRSG